MDMEFATADDGAALRCWRGGAVDGPGLLLVPGLFADVDVYAGLARHLDPAWQLWSWELRGLDDGDAVPFDRHVRDAVAVLDHFGGERAVVVGWSAGACIAGELVRQHPSRAVGFCAIAGTFGGPIERLLRRWVGPAADALPLALGAGGLAGRGLQAPTRWIDALRGRAPVTLLRLAGVVGELADDRPIREALARTFGRDVGRSAAAWSALATHLVEGEKPEVACPSLWLAGSRDPLAGPVVMRLAAAGAVAPDQHIVRGGGHFLPLEQPELVGLMLRRFVAGLSPAR